MQNSWKNTLKNVLSKEFTVEDEGGNLIVRSNDGCFLFFEFQNNGILCGYVLTDMADVNNRSVAEKFSIMYNSTHKWPSMVILDNGVIALQYFLHLDEDQLLSEESATFAIATVLSFVWTNNYGISPQVEFKKVIYGGLTPEQAIKNISK